MLGQKNKASFILCHFLSLPSQMGGCLTRCWMEWQNARPEHCKLVSIPASTFLSSFSNTFLKKVCWKFVLNRPLQLCIPLETDHWPLATEQLCSVDKIQDVHSNFHPALFQEKKFTALHDLNHAYPQIPIHQEFEETLLLHPGRSSLLVKVMCCSLLSAS